MRFNHEGHDTCHPSTGSGHRLPRELRGVRGRCQGVTQHLHLRCALAQMQVRKTVKALPSCPFVAFVVKGFACASLPRNGSIPRTAGRANGPQKPTLRGLRLRPPGANGPLWVGGWAGELYPAATDGAYGR